MSLSVALFGSYAAEIESVIPAYSMGYVAIENVSGIWDAMMASPSWQLLLASSNLEDAIGQVEELLGVDLQTLMGAFGRRIAFVQVHTVPDPDGLSLSAVIIDVGDSEGASEVVRRMEQKLGSNEDLEIRPDAGTYQSVPFGLVGLRGEQLSLKYAFLDNLLVFAIGQDSFEAIVDVYLGEDPSLIYDPKYNRTCADISNEHEIFAYINMELLWPIMGIGDRDMSQLLQIIGAHEIKSIAYTANLLSTTSREQDAYLFTGGIRGGAVTSLFTPNQSLSSPHLIPASGADMFFAIHLGDPTTTWGKLRDGVRNVLGEDEYADMQDGISELEREMGLSLNDDILESLTGEVGIAMPLSALMGAIGGPESLLSGGLVFFGVEDREKCAISIEKIFSAASIQTQQMEYRGVTLYGIQTSSSSEIPVGYMVADDLLVFGNFKRLEAIINEEPPLVVSEAFARVNSQLSRQSGLLCYIDLGSSAEMLWEAGLLNLSEEYMMRLRALGSISGEMDNDGEGLRARWVGTPGKSWLETIGELAALLTGALR